MEQGANASENTGDAAPAANPRCCYRSCRVNGADKHECTGNGCEKTAHLVCYQAHLLQKHSLSPIPGNKVACTKKGYEKAMKQASGGVDEEGGRSGEWDSDGLDGGDDKNTSMTILID